MGKNFKNFILEKVDLPTHYSVKEEIVNSISHLVGACFSLVVLLFISIKAIFISEYTPSWSLVVFLLTMTTMYSFSTLYHGSKDEFRKRLYRVGDHSSIYLLIAGTYTPIVVAIDSSLSGFVLGLVWTFAIVGIVFTMFFWGKFKIFHVLTYLIMGWLVVFFWKDFSALMNTGLIVCMVLGGLLYTLGTILYSIKSIPYAHGVWHLFVFSASISFFVGIFFFL